MSSPLMPKSTAVWLVENTSLTFEQNFKVLQPSYSRSSRHC